MDYGRALNALSEWASARDDVRALVLTGSAAARDAHPLSDRDVAVFTTDIPRLMRDDSWWNDLGEVLVVERLEDGEGNPTRLVYFAGGKLDFTLFPVGRLPSRVTARPFQVLLDKDDDFAADVAATTVADFAASSLCDRGTAIPSVEAFDESINWAWAAALMEAKAIVRDEPWSVKLRDQDLKAELLRMIEWDHQLRRGAGLDTRYLGTGMRRWMDSDIQIALERCWGGFDAEGSTRALLASLALYRPLAERTAEALRFPSFDHARLEAEMRSILDFGRPSEGCV
ncbi:MAG: aminoglycoside 6-adenylyltransferase [Pseudoclavibacter sp.]